ncbi:MAG: hypothetical protein OEZ36_00505, partial [Spirochaetota bacterium]|nr:hypothetical protein [Spirochaetota bacterium]
MKIKTKLLIGFGIITSLLIITAGISYIIDKRIQQNVKNISDEVVQETYLALDLRYDIVSIQQYLTDISATRGWNGLDDGLEKASLHYRDAYVKISKLVTLFKKDPETLNILKKMSIEIKEYYVLGEKMALAYINGGPEKGNPYMEKLDPFAIKLTRTLDTMVQKLKKRLSGDLSSMTKAADFKLLVDMILAVVGIAMAIIITFIITHSILVPLRKVAGVLDRMSDEKTGTT